MPSYTLEWTIDWDADSPKEAAQEVTRRFFGNVGLADHFTVIDQETGESVEVNAFSGGDEEEDEEPEVLHCVCEHCNLDIEGFAPYPDGGWRDRGNNAECPDRDGVSHSPVRTL